MYVTKLRLGPLCGILASYPGSPGKEASGIPHVVLVLSLSLGELVSEECDNILSTEDLKRNLVNCYHDNTEAT